MTDWKLMAEPTKKGIGEKLYLLLLTLVGIVMCYLGWLGFQIRQQPPLNQHLYIDQVYKGK